MVPKSRPVTAKAIQTLLTRIGSASSGTKDVLHARLGHDLRKRRLLDSSAESKSRKEKERRRQLRIVSIDMGIKNLAFCDATVDYQSGSGFDATMNIISWDKIDLVNTTQTNRKEDFQLALDEPKSSDEKEDPFSLEVLSKTAYWFLKTHVLAAFPDIILIERQRWRSSNSAAIQQWTVRVNTLEAMIWAILDALKAEHSSAVQRLGGHDKARNYQVFGVDPKRVGQYWLGQHAKALQQEDGSTETDVVDQLAAEEEEASKSKKISRSKAEKKAKIALLRSWLCMEPPSTGPSTPTSDPMISFIIGPGASKAREALCLPKITRKKASKSSKTPTQHPDEEQDVNETQIKKLDDVTDCFLQAAAWVAWDSNRTQLAKIWNAKRGDNGALPDLSDEILKEMVQEAE